MAQKLFSTSLGEFSGVITNAALLGSLKDLQYYLGKRKLNIRSWDENNIAVPLAVNVELPPLGNFNDIDIRGKEFIVVVLNLSEYPTIAPVVFPDRLDFPKNKLAHLYVAQNGKPPAFCLIRGSLNDWYANKQLKDLYIRVENWLRDAATGELTEDGNQFDPIRLEGYTGTMIYDYDEVVATTNAKKSFFTDTNFAIAIFERNTSNDRVVYKLATILTPGNFKQSFDDFRKEREKAAEDGTKKNLHVGYIVWSENEEVYNDYTVDLPTDWSSLKQLCERHGINLAKLEKHIATLDFNIFLKIPVITAIRRSKKIIGFSDTIEFFNFTIKIDTPDVQGESIINNVPVSFYSHSQPLTRKKAQGISGFYAGLGVCALVAGCGALGSKIVMHLARSGTTNFFLADPDTLSPHNLVRHALLGNREGLDKAGLLKKEIEGLFPYEKDPLLLSVKAGGKGMLSEKFLKLYDWVFDFTASESFFQTLVLMEFPENTRICRAFITDFGNLGIMLLEGKQRNPRLDDLQIMLYAQFRKLTLVSDWLKRESEQKKKETTVTVGVGCNSETTVLADDIISLHGAYFSGTIKTESRIGLQEEGRIFLNQISNEPFFSTVPRLLKLPPMVVVKAINDPAWQIRLAPGIIELMKEKMGLAMPSEIGGVFIGCSNYKTKTIHVVELVNAPPDSTANPVCFFRGVQGLPEAIEEINGATGNQLGYIGEWHTHPFGPNGLSNVDTNAVRNFKKEFSHLPTPLPVFLMIVTPTHILPYVF
jgi:hypothetical protein